MRNFNPRSHEGSDPVDAHETQVVRISIHAPVKGATTNDLYYVCPIYISIHAPVKGATPAVPRLLPDLRDFNPRSREGSDDRALRVGLVRPISIHAPVKGATDGLP